jgi:hypothetical protein
MVVRQMKYKFKVKQNVFLTGKGNLKPGQEIQHDDELDAFYPRFFDRIVVKTKSQKIEEVEDKKQKEEAAIKAQIEDEILEADKIDKEDEVVITKKSKKTKKSK